MALTKVLKATTDSELLSYIINQTPELSAEIDLPVQGQSIAKYGELIVNNERYKNAFLNTVNLIGLTVITRNYWDNPWEVFANKGTLRFGQQVRELMVDIANVYDYQTYANDVDHFLENVVPNVYNYIYEVNYEKFYKTTTSDTQMAMAFETEGGLMEFIEMIIASLYEGYKYDKYIVDKYQLCKRIVGGTVTAIEIPNYANLTPRQRVSFMKSVSNKMTFRSPNYNPVGARKSTSFDNQILIMNTDFEADMSTDVLATSFFKNEAEMKVGRLALIDGFGNHDTQRLQELLGDSYVPFTEAELTMLAKVPGMIIGIDFFQDRDYVLNTQGDSTRQTEFFNPETLKTNHWLHTKKVIATSPYENAAVFVLDTPSVTNVAINPSESTVSAGQTIQLSATVTTTGAANKAVQWIVEEAPGEVTKVSVDGNGKVVIPSDYEPTDTEDPNPIVIKAISIYDDSKEAEATITVV